jgi:hypothetical protein
MKLPDYIENQLKNYTRVAGGIYVKIVYSQKIVDGQYVVGYDAICVNPYNEDSLYSENLDAVDSTGDRWETRYPLFHYISVSLVDQLKDWEFDLKDIPIEQQEAAKKHLDNMMKPLIMKYESNIAIMAQKLRKDKHVLGKVTSEGVECQDPDIELGHMLEASGLKILDSDYSYYGEEQANNASFCGEGERYDRCFSNVTIEIARQLIMMFGKDKSVDDFNFVMKTIAKRRLTWYLRWKSTAYDRHYGMVISNLLVLKDIDYDEYASEYRKFLKQIASDLLTSNILSISKGCTVTVSELLCEAIIYDEKYERFFGLLGEYVIVTNYGDLDANIKAFAAVLDNMKLNKLSDQIKLALTLK